MTTQHSLSNKDRQHLCIQETDTRKWIASPGAKQAGVDGWIIFSNRLLIYKSYLIKVLKWVTRQFSTASFAKEQYQNTHMHYIIQTVENILSGLFRLHSRLCLMFFQCLKKEENQTAYTNLLTKGILSGINYLKVFTVLISTVYKIKMGER